MSIPHQAQYKLRKFIHELKPYRARHTELISVYVPEGYDITKIIQHLMEEQGTASNIKDKTTRGNVIDALERMIRHLRLYPRTPEHGVVVFSGNISTQPGKGDIQVWSVEPPVSLNLRLYRCDQTFVLDPLEELIEIKEVYGVIAMDNREATIGLLRGHLIQVIKELTSGVPGKFKAGGQCLSSDTLVQLADGGIVPISTMHNPLVVKSFNFTHDSFSDSPVLEVWNSGEKGVVKIITTCPRLEIDASESHTFFVYEHDKVIEKRSKDLKVGDFLLMPEKINVQGKKQAISTDYYNSYFIDQKGRDILFSSRKELRLLQRELGVLTGLSQHAIYKIEQGKRSLYSHQLSALCRTLHLSFPSFLSSYCSPSDTVRLPSLLDERLAQLLGYFLGDGNAEVDRLNFSEQDEDLALYYSQEFSSFFHAHTSFRFRSSKNYYELRVQGRALLRFLQGEFPELKNALSSSIPHKIFTSEDSVVAAFVRGLFDAEGYTTKDELSIGMNNKRVIRELQMLLLRLGVISSFCFYDNKGNPYSDNPRYTLRITDRVSLIAFQHLIGFSLLRKRNGLQALIFSRSSRNNIRQILRAGSSIRKLIENYGMKITDFSKVSNFFRDGRMMGKETFSSSILSHIENPFLREKLVSYLDYQLIPVKVKSIVPTGEIVPMYDISVKQENFIANGVLVHNSQARFARLREEAANEFYKRIAEVANKEFGALGGHLKGILLGGPGITKETFLNAHHLHTDLTNKVISVQDLAYTSEFGLRELVDKSQDLLADQEMVQERAIVNKFLETLAKDSEKAAYGAADVKKALDYGAVETLLMSESFDHTDTFLELADKTGAKVFFLSEEMKEGAQIRDLGKVAAILRFGVGG